MKQTLKRSWMGAKWMLVTVVKPEIVIAKNTADIFGIKHEATSKLTRMAEDGVLWSRIHSLFVNMGLHLDTISRRVSKTI